MLLQGIGRNDRDAVYPPVFAIADRFCCGLSGIEAEDCSLASLRQIFLTLPAAGAQRSVLGGKIADTRRPGPPPVGGGTRLWYSCYDIFLREGQPMTHGTPPFSADAALRHFRSYFTEPKSGLPAKAFRSRTARRLKSIFTAVFVRPSVCSPSTSVFGVISIQADSALARRALRWREIAPSSATASISPRVPSVSRSTVTSPRKAPAFMKVSPRSTLP